MNDFEDTMAPRTREAVGGASGRCVEDRSVELMAATDKGTISQGEVLSEGRDSVKIDIARSKISAGKPTILGHVVPPKSDPEELKSLLRRQKVDVEQTTDGDIVPQLHLAAYAGNIETVTLLCNSSDINLRATTDRTSLSVLHMSVKGGDPRIVGHILHEANQRVGCCDPTSFSRFLNTEDNMGMTALHHAAWEGHEAMVAQLLHYKDAVDVNAQDSHGFTPLHFASWNNRLEVVHRLLGHPQIDPGVKSKHFVWIMGDLNSNNGMQIGMRNIMKGQEMYLPGYADRGSRKSLIGYIPSSMDEVRRNLEGRVPARFLPAFFPDRNNDDVTALHCAAFTGHSDTVRALVEGISLKSHARKTLNAVDNRLMSALHYAIIRGDASTVEELSTSSMVRGTQEEVGCNLTPLDMASMLIHQTKDPKIVREYKVIKSVLLERPDVKGYMESLYRDRQVFVEAANAILVGGALIASITFAGWLQPPLGYSPYYETRYLMTGSAPPNTYASFASVEHHACVQIFWVFNSLSFFFAISTVLTGAGAVLPTQDTFGKAEVDHIRTVLIRTSLVLSTSIFFALGAFVAAGFAPLPPSLQYQWGMISTSGLGGTMCLLVLYYYLKRLVRLFRFERVTGGFKEKVVHAFHITMDHDSAGLHH